MILSLSLLLLLFHHHQASKPIQYKYIGWHFCAPLEINKTKLRAKSLLLKTHLFFFCLVCVFVCFTVFILSLGQQIDSLVLSICCVLLVNCWCEHNMKLLLWYRYCSYYYYYYYYRCPKPSIYCKHMWSGAEKRKWTIKYGQSNMATWLIQDTKCHCCFGTGVQNSF